MLKSIGPNELGTGGNSVPRERHTMGKPVLIVESEFIVASEMEPILARAGDTTAAIAANMQNAIERTQDTPPAPAFVDGKLTDSPWLRRSPNGRTTNPP